MILDWILSAGSILLLILMGNKWKYAPIYGVFFQLFWFIYIFQTKHLGLLPGVIVYTFVHLRNARKWLRENTN